MERDLIWDGLDKPWDLVVVGGGIVGAGIFRQAARLGLRVLLVEQRDFAWGTSSRSSKFVHGGLRYLKDLDLRMARESVAGRECLLRDGRGLVEPVQFLLTRHVGDPLGKLGYQAALALYDLLAGGRSRRHYDIEQLRLLVPQLGEARLIDSFACAEAQTDDARLTLRVLVEGIDEGGFALNYVRAGALAWEKNQVVGIELHDLVKDRAIQVPIRLVVNATGAWADQLRSQVKASRLIRPLRGSHLVFPGWRIPVAQVISINHPVDHRPVCIFPWHTVTLVGSTDLDHHSPLEEEPRINPYEAAYLMAAVDYAFPGLNLSLEDATGSFAGVRPVINTGKVNPSKESRDHMILFENGLLTVTGGKLTTFQDVAWKVLRSLPVGRLPAAGKNHRSALEPAQVVLEQPEPVRTRLLGRYGNAAVQVSQAAKAGELAEIPGTNALWIELRWAARCEWVVHLEDLMLRRVPLGIILPGGGCEFLPRVRAICQGELGWTDDRWASEVRDYHRVWKQNYFLPEQDAIPDWKGWIRNAVGL